MSTGKKRYVVRWSPEDELMPTATLLIKIMKEDQAKIKLLGPAGVIILAAILEATLNAAVDYLSGLYGKDKNFSLTIKSLKATSVRSKLAVLPLIATKSCFTINYKSKVVEDLFDLVDRRNKIVHIKSETHVLEEPFNESDLKKPVVRSKFLAPLHDISVALLLRYKVAIEFLDKEFIKNISTGKYGKGEILRECNYIPGKE